MEAKDYISLSFSGVAVAISMFNLWRGARDGKAIKKQKWNQMRSEAIIAVIDERSSIRSAAAALEAARFDARLAHDSEAVTAADRLIEMLNSALVGNAALEAGLRETPVLKGTSAELSEMERRLGALKALGASDKQAIENADSVADAIWRKLMAAKEI